MRVGDFRLFFKTKMTETLCKNKHTRPIILSTNIYQANIVIHSYSPWIHYNQATVFAAEIHINAMASARGASNFEKERTDPTKSNDLSAVLLTTVRCWADETAVRATGTW